LHTFYLDIESVEIVSNKIVISVSSKVVSHTIKRGVMSKTNNRTSSCANILGAAPFVAIARAFVAVSHYLLPVVELLGSMITGA
jgi:phage-related minor tail protein